MVKSHGDFVTIIDLPEGDHEYKFCVDGEWRHDPKLVSVCDVRTLYLTLNGNQRFSIHWNSQKNIDNDIGSKNNLVSVRQSDFEVFQALAKDSEDIVNNAQKEYSQDIPVDKPWGSGPPVLPPHLLQVILNKDTPISVRMLLSISNDFHGSEWFSIQLFLLFSSVWTDLVAWTKSRYVESFVCAIDKGWGHGAQRNASLSQKIRYNFAVQTDLSHIIARRIHLDGRMWDIIDLIRIVFGFIFFGWYCDCLQSYSVYGLMLILYFIRVPFMYCI